MHDPYIRPWFLTSPTELGERHALTLTNQAFMHYVHRVPREPPFDPYIMREPCIHTVNIASLVCSLLCPHRASILFEFDYKLFFTFVITGVKQL